MKVNLKYKLKQKITLSDYIVTLIGFEYVEERGLRYILLSINENKTDWLYLYEFEIEALKVKISSKLGIT